MWSHRGVMNILEVAEGQAVMPTCLVGLFPRSVPVFLEGSTDSCKELPALCESAHRLSESTFGTTVVSQEAVMGSSGHRPGRGDASVSALLSMRPLRITRICRGKLLV